jgi:hypothetical protein
MVLLLLFVANIWQDGAMMLGRFPKIFILWPLNNELLQALKQLVQKQLEHKHIEPSFSPWNSLVPWSFLTRPDANSHRQGPTAGSNSGVPL